MSEQNTGLEKFASQLEDIREQGAILALDELASDGVLNDEGLEKAAGVKANYTLEKVAEEASLNGSISTANAMLEYMRANPEKTAAKVADELEAAINDDYAEMAPPAEEEITEEVEEAALEAAVEGAAEIIAAAAGASPDDPDVVAAAEEVIAEADAEAPAEAPVEETVAE